VKRQTGEKKGRKGIGCFNDALKKREIAKGKEKVRRPRHWWKQPGVKKASTKEIAKSLETGQRKTSNRGIKRG